MPTTTLQGVPPESPQSPLVGFPAAWAGRSRKDAIGILSVHRMVGQVHAVIAQVAG